MLVLSGPYATSKRIKPSCGHVLVCGLGWSISPVRYWSHECPVWSLAHPKRARRAVSFSNC